MTEVRIYPFTWKTSVSYLYAAYSVLCRCHTVYQEVSYQWSQNIEQNFTCINYFLSDYCFLPVAEKKIFRDIFLATKMWFYMGGMEL